MSDVATLMAQLDSAATRVDKASTRMAKALQEFEGVPDDNGEWQPGPKFLYESQVKAEATKVWTQYESKGNKPPPESVRESRAEALVKERDPDLWADYHRLKAETEQLQKWISSQRDCISARQTLISTEKALLPIQRVA